MQHPYNAVDTSRRRAVTFAFVCHDTALAMCAGIEATCKADAFWREHKIIGGHKRCPDLVALVRR